MYAGGEGSVIKPIITLIIFAITLALLMLRPRNLKEGYAGGIGALLMLLSGAVSLPQAIKVALGTGNILVMFLSMMVLSIVVDMAGFFEWSSMHAINWARGNGHRLFLATFLLGTAVTTVISNDATALIITPIVYAFVLRLGLTPLPFLLACTFIADTASLSLPVSNLINILVYDRLAMGFLEYVAVMFLPNLVAVLINIGVFYLIFRSQIPRELPVREHIDPMSSVKHKPFFISASVILGLTTVGYVVGSALQIPLSVVALTGALTSLAAGAFHRQITFREVESQVSWSVLCFVVSMFIVVAGVQNIGLTEKLGSVIINLSSGSRLKAILLTGFGTALGSNLINNVPMDVVMISAIETVAPLGSSLSSILGYATVLGCDLGPNITTIGSLATMLWIASMRRKGYEVSPLTYFKIGLLTTPPMILASSLALYVSTLWL